MVTPCFIQKADTYFRRKEQQVDTDQKYLTADTGRKSLPGDTERKEQKRNIEQLVAYIDERSSHYNKGRPALTRNPSSPYPRVEWNRINIHTKRNLPQPQSFPVLSCPKDPNIYPDAPNPKGRVMELYTPTSMCQIPGCEHVECNPSTEVSTTIHLDESGSRGFKAISRNKEGAVLLSKTYVPLQATSFPFGSAAGFQTNLGVVSPPDSPVNGFVYTKEGWVLHATSG